MKPVEGEKNRTISNDTLYHISPAEYTRMQNDLLHAGSYLIVIGILALLFIISGWYQNPNYFTLIWMTIGGIIGLLIPWIGVERTKFLEYHLGAPAHLTTYEQKLQHVIWKNRKHWIMVLSISPYFLWIYYEAFFKRVPIAGNFNNAFVIILFSTVCIFGFAMGILSLQVNWSLGRELRKHPQG